LSDSLFDDPAQELHGPIEAVAASEDLTRLGRHLPQQVFLGTSSWAFPGWHGLVYEHEYPESRLTRDGLSAYGRHPVLRAVGVDRGTYLGLDAADWSRYAKQVPDGFRFMVPAPAAVTEAVPRGPRRSAGPGPASSNPRFLDATYATEHFVMPALEGLGHRAGPLVLQFSPMPPELTREPHALIERIAGFLARLPASHSGVTPLYAVELRNPELLTPRFVHRLREVGARLCIGIHARMPPVARQAAALRSMDASDAADGGWNLSGALVVRWSLRAGMTTEQARPRYAPFNRLVDPDLVTRGTLVHLIRVAVRSRQSAFIIVSNEAEGCAPLSCVELARALADRSEAA
jgi:uncharacterized protein YecE (DUF72 family)